MRPYGGKHLTQKKLSWKVLEYSFAIIINKWGIFHKPLNVFIGFSENIVKACNILQNFVRDRDGFHVEDMFAYEGLGDIDQLDVTNAGQVPMKIRDTFVDYFCAAGDVPWQYVRI
ncbi:hypothetical protein PR048_011520 [Dryococelus australis]|uniref:Uncharacterized protein n=1 Tax=Dryococelus australis TaxID=614101 RepID=A0ABQ9HN42_9NEOP|nr:hypothetical protein PR048_011520 [Dryococelus australis]